MRTLIMVFMVVGSSAGSYVPVLWGGSVFSASSIFFGAIGGLAGIWVGYKLAQQLGLG